MWCLAPLLLLLASGAAEPQYDYASPSIPFEVKAQQCEPIRSVIYTTSVQESVITQQQVNQQVQTVTSYQQQVVPTTLYQTQFQTDFRYQTSFVQQPTQVNQEQVVTVTQPGGQSFQTRYETSVRVVPQVSYVVSTVVQTQVVPIEVTSTRYQTQYNDQVQYQTSVVYSTSVVQVQLPGSTSTVFQNQFQNTPIQQPGPVITSYVTTTLVQQSVQIQSIPSPPVFITSVFQSQRVIPTEIIRTRFENQVSTRTQFVTRTQFQTETKVQTQYIPREVVVTSGAQRVVYRTEYTTQVVPQSVVQTIYSTIYNNPRPVISTQISYYQSVVQAPLQAQVVTSQIVRTEQRQQVVYRTQFVQQPVTQTRYVQAPCRQQVYRPRLPGFSVQF